MTKRRGDAVVCQEAFGKGQGGKVALLVKPEQKLWFSIDYLRKGFSQCINENREKFYLMAVFLQPQYRKSGTFSVSRKGTISNGSFFSWWRHECLLSWPVKVLQNQTNSFSPVWMFSFVTDESAAKLDKQLVKRELCFLWKKYPPLKHQSSTCQLILFLTSPFKQSPSSLAVLSPGSPPLSSTSSSLASMVGRW